MLGTLARLRNEVRPVANRTQGGFGTHTLRAIQTLVTHSVKRIATHTVVRGRPLATQMSNELYRVARAVLVAGTTAVFEAGTQVVGRVAVFASRRAFRAHNVPTVTLFRVRVSAILVARRVLGTPCVAVAIHASVGRLVAQTMRRTRAENQLHTVDVRIFHEPVGKLARR